VVATRRRAAEPSEAAEIRTMMIPTATVTEPAILIRIPRLFREGMSSEALYEATRSQWRLGPRRERAQLALAVVNGLVREVYRIEAWHPAGTIPQKVIVHTESPIPGRWEFVGTVAHEAERAKYIDHSVAAYFPRGMANPITYVNC
jgi:hypothetical protein